jgi:hypothetical protein
LRTPVKLLGFKDRDAQDAELLNLRDWGVVSLIAFESHHGTSATSPVRFEHSKPTQSTDSKYSTRTPFEYDFPNNLYGNSRPFCYFVFNILGDTENNIEVDDVRAN